ncbi:MAG TPA: hypothetical protein VGM78_13895, partial [Ilumatobacteraceae bacterium]
HQDLAFNTAMTGRAPLLDAHRDSLGLASFAPGAGLAEAEDLALAAALDLEQLVRYAGDVNDAVSTWLGDMDVSAVDGVPPANERVAGIAGIPVDGALSWLHAMWNGKPVAWFVQWECIGHRHTHVGEMTALRNRLGFSPF